MNNILDNISEIKKLDSKNMLGSLQLLSKQVEEVFASSKNLKIPASYKKINKILVLGMGGSALGSHLVKTLFAQDLKIPFEIINDYHIPNFVDKNTAVLASSYSGTTEETISAMKEALKRKAKVMGIASGGEIFSRCQKNKLPILKYTTQNNPCNSPRMGLGYSIVGQLILFSKLGLIKIPAIKNIADILKKYENLFGVNQTSTKNQAKILAQNLFDKQVFYLASGHLSGNSHVAGNQMNENAKRFGGYFIIPELNHHLLEGMIYPSSNKQTLAFALLRSTLYDKRVQKRFEITADVLNKNGIKNWAYDCAEKTKLGQALEVLVLGSYLSFYSALLQGIDPTAIPFVDYFKEQLAK